MKGISLSQLNCFFNAWKEQKNNTRKKKATPDWEKNMNWDNSIKNVLTPLPKTYKLPSGGEITSIEFNRNKSRSNKLIFTITFKHAEKTRGTPLTHHDVIITPCFQRQFVFTITGKDKSCMKSYLTDYFYTLFHLPRY